MTVDVQDSPQPLAEPTSGASTKRRVLAIYVDYLVFTSVYEPIAWTIRSVTLSNWLVTLAVFAVLRFFAQRVSRVLPGDWALGIGPPPARDVDAYIRRRERWWTLLAGTLLVLEGSKNLVRWTQGLPVPPLLGAAAPHALAVAVISLLGLANMVAGLLILRTRTAGAWIGMAILAAEGVATIVHADAFRAWTADAVVARRTLQGLPVREGEIDMMQSLNVTVMPVLMLAWTVWVIAILIRFHRRSSDGE